MDVRACPVCNSSATTVCYLQFDNPWWRCADCGLRFREPREVVAYESGCCAAQASFYYGADFVSAYRRAWGEFLPYVKHGRFLEVGFGHGGYLAAARELGFDVLGLDTSPRNVEEVAGRFALPVRQATLEQAALPETSFDTAMMSHVIEHLPDPVGTLVELARVLTKEGTLLLVTPNAGCYLERLLGHRWPMYRPPDHIRLFTPDSLRLAVKRAGFRVTRLWTTDSPADFPLGLASALRGATGIPGTTELLAQASPTAVPAWRRLAYKTLPLVGYPFLLTRYLGIASCLKCVATKAVGG
ncbi:MAG: class I SAM-dependent methyltransferase [Terriglobia bacterium]